MAVGRSTSCRPVGASRRLPWRSGFAGERRQAFVLSANARALAAAGSQRSRPAMVSLGADMPAPVSMLDVTHQPLALFHLTPVSTLRRPA